MFRLKRNRSYNKKQFPYSVYTKESSSPKWRAASQEGDKKWKERRWLDYLAKRAIKGRHTNPVVRSQGSLHNILRFGSFTIVCKKVIAIPNKLGRLNLCFNWIGS